MSENRKNELEVTMSGKTQDKPKSSESLSAGFRKVEKLGNKVPTTKVDIPNKITDSVSTGKANEQNRGSVQERKSPVLNIAKQIQTNHQSERIVLEENSYSEKEPEENKEGKAIKKVTHNNNGSKKKKGQIIAGIVAAVTVIVAIILLWPCEHEWVDATCTTAKTCSKCDAVEGEPLGHSWKKATCTKPSECKLCKETEGKALGHKWTETTEYDYIQNKIIRYGVCKICNAKEKKDTAPLTTLLDNDKMGFRISPVDFMNRLNSVYKKMEKDFDINCMWSDNVSLGNAGVEIYDGDGNELAWIDFGVNREDKLYIKSTDKNEDSSFDYLSLNTHSNVGGTYEVALGFLLACDPTLDGEYDNLLLLAEAAISTVQRGDLLYRAAPSAIMPNVMLLLAVPAELAETW